MDPRFLLLSVLSLATLSACDSDESPAGATESTGAASAETRAVEAAPEAPPAPEELTEIDASTLPSALREHPGRVLLVNVWSTFCAPCVEEMPELVSIGRRYQRAGLGLMLISADPPANRGAAMVFLRSEGAPFPSYLKTGSEDRFIRALHEDWSGSLPATLLLDSERRVLHFWERPVDLDTLRPAIDNALAREATRGM